MEAYMQCCNVFGYSSNANAGPLSEEVVIDTPPEHEEQGGAPELEEQSHGPAICERQPGVQLGEMQACCLFRDFPSALLW